FWRRGLCDDGDGLCFVDRSRAVRRLDRSPAYPCQALALAAGLEDCEAAKDGTPSRLRGAKVTYLTAAPFVDGERSPTRPRGSGARGPSRAGACRDVGEGSPRRSG